MAVEEFTLKTLDLLALERDAEIEETQTLNQRLSARELERKGVCLLKLHLKSRRSGLYGRMIGTFEPSGKSRDRNAKPELPSHNITPGDIVGVSLMTSEPTDKPLVTGIVSQVSASNISLACEEGHDMFELDEDELFKLTKLANDVTYRRLKNTLNELAKYRNGPSQRLIDVFFCQAEISKPSGDFPVTFVNESLDSSQQEAVRFALKQREVAVIHGPPGTGKTTTVVELIVQAVRQGLKILATAPSNIAVDNLVERLAAHKQRIVRIGHPARLLSHLQKYSLDAIVSGTEEKSIVKDVHSDLHKIMTKLKKAKNSGERRALREEMKYLRREATQRQEALTKDVLSRADVVLVTLTSASDEGPLKHLAKDHFDLVVIDECSQALEAACWIGLLRGPRCVLAGDHLQLPPTILSKKAASDGLALTLMERTLQLLVESKGHDVVRMLTTQYRMHSAIMDWASQQLYQGKLTAHPSVAGHLLSDLSSVDPSEEASLPLLLIDTAGCDLQELDLPEEISKGNEGEADIVTSHVMDLVKMGVKPVDIAVISPYNLQVDLLRLRLSSQYPELEVKSVDGFQGREKEAVVISMVRSNDTGEVGFLADKRRINVAVTRARRHLCVVCDSETVCHDSFIKSLITYMTEKGEVWSAHQYVQEGKVSTVCSRPERLTNAMDKKEKNDAKSGKTRHPQSKQKQPTILPQQTTEEKSVVYQEQLGKFLESPETMLEFPASLNSHDRMVIHEVAQKLGLHHCSVGEGKDRHIQVSKVGLTTPNSQNSSVFSESQSAPIAHQNSERLESLRLSDDETLTEETVLKSQSSGKGGGSDSTALKVESGSVGIDPSDVDLELCEDTASFSRDEMLLSLETDPVSSVILLDKKANEMKSDKKTEVKEEVSKTTSKSKENDTVKNLQSVCSHCKKDIFNTSLLLHELHCSRQSRVASSSQETQSVKPKKDVKPKQKKAKGAPKVTHVQKVADVLDKVDNEDFDALIASVTKLDSMCAFKKCKTLTNTLGRNCEFCTRRFCLTHLMPEVHGCGDAVKDAARRVTIRDGVLHRGTSAPVKKPNDTRRAQLEHRMEKKMGELAEKRTRNQGKKKS